MFNTLKILIVYYSRTGSTRKIANELKGLLSADLEEIIDTKNRAGIFGWLFAGKDIMLKKPTQIKEIKSKIEDYDLIVIGTPVWAFTEACAVKSFLKNYAAKMKNVAFFVTMGGSGGKKILVDMKNDVGKTPKATEIFLEKDIKNENYIDSLKSFAGQLKG